VAFVRRVQIFDANIIIFGNLFLINLQKQLGVIRLLHRHSDLFGGLTNPARQTAPPPIQLVAQIAAFDLQALCQQNGNPLSHLLN